MSAAITALEQRAEQLRDQLDFKRRSLAAYERGALAEAIDDLRLAQSVSEDAKREITEDEKALGEVNAALHALRGTRPVADRPQA